MKLLYVQRDYPAPDDYGRDYAEIAAGLAGLGHEVTVATPHRVVEGHEWRGTKVVDLPRDARAVGLRAPALLSNLAGGRSPAEAFDACFVHEWWNLGSHAMAHAATRAGLPVLYAPWASLNPWAIGRDVRAVAKRALCRVLARWYGALPPTLCLYDEVDAGYAADLGLRWPWTLGALPVYTYAPHHPSFDWQAALGRPVVGRRILFFNARLDIWQKGFDELLAGFRLAARQRGASFRTLLVLSGRAPNGPLASDGPRAEAMARPLCDEGLAVWKGFLSADDRIDMLAHCDMFVYPTRADGPPRPLREALWRGTPLMITPQSGLATWVRRHGAGIPIQAPDAASIAQAVLRFDALPDDGITRLRDACRGLAERLTTQRLAGDYAENLRAAIENHRRAASRTKEA